MKAVAVIGQIVLAVEAPPAPPPGVDTTPITNILSSVQGTLVAILVTGAVVALVWAGFRYVVAGVSGDPQSIEKAKTTAKSALIGLAVVLLAPILVGIVRQVLGR